MTGFQNIPEYSGDIILISEVAPFDLDLDWKKLLRSENTPNRGDSRLKI
jgi:hypothetical protein